MKTTTRTALAPSEPTSEQIVALALGRIFRMGSRPTQPGDVEEYERCRALILEHAVAQPESWTPNYVRDYGKGH